MKRLFTLVMTLVLANMAMITKAGTAEIEKKAKEHISKATQELSLTKEQGDKLYPLAVEFFTEKESIKTGKMSEPDKRKAMAELREKMANKAKPFLTEAQIAKWKQLQEDKQKAPARR